jgi:hypothetical protein
MSTSDAKCTVHFKTQWRGDGGLRIYTTNPTGLYISSSSTYAAAEYFQRFSVGVAVLDMILRGIKPDNAFTTNYEFEWENIVAAGGGECEFFTVPMKEISEEFAMTFENRDGDFPPIVGEEEPPMAEIELKVEPRMIGEKNVLVIQDVGETDSVLEEIIRRQETMQ